MCRSLASLAVVPCRPLCCVQVPLRPLQVPCRGPLPRPLGRSLAVCRSPTQRCPALCRARSLPFPPPAPLPPPRAMPTVPEEVVSVELANLGLMTPEEEQSNQQLLYVVRLAPALS